MPEIRAIGGASLTQARPEVLEGELVAFDLNEDAIAVVAHATGEGETGGQAVDEGAKTNTLDDTDHPDPMTSLGGGQGRHACCVLRCPRITAASRCIRPKL